MDVTYFFDEFPYIIIDNMYNESELELIWKELDLFNSGNFLLSPSQSYSATNENGDFLKQNGSIILDHVYKNRNVSPILNCNRKIFDVKITDVCKKHWALRMAGSATRDGTVLSYYENTDYYDFHYDASHITILTHFYKEPKSFSGGDVVFENNMKYKIKNNRSIMFPGTVNHSVEKIEMETTKNGYGRWVMAQFLSFADYAE